MQEKDQKVTSYLRPSVLLEHTFTKLEQFSDDCLKAQNISWWWKSNLKLMWKNHELECVSELQRVRDLGRGVWLKIRWGTSKAAWEQKEITLPFLNPMACMHTFRSALLCLKWFIELLMFSTAKITGKYGCVVRAFGQTMALKSYWKLDFG